MASILADNPSFIQEWDTVGKCPYWHAPATNNLITIYTSYGASIDASIIFYENEESINEKTAFIGDQGMKSVMFWTLAQMKLNSQYPLLNFVNLFR